MLVMERKRLSGKRFSQFVSRSHQDTIHNVLKVEPGGEEKSVEVEMRRQDGMSFYALLKVLVEPGDGDVRYRVAVTDITDRKKAEEALKDSQKNAVEQANRLQAVLDTAPALIWMAFSPPFVPGLTSPNF